jgi:putative component of membrane protein insertase Oxa1/YidC/SpoIIIJ protein YidD
MSMHEAGIHGIGFGILPLFAQTPAFATRLAAAAIRGYQRWISPYKGFRCAHRVLHHGRSCSQFALDAILARGLLPALPTIREQFRQCRAAAVRLRQQRRPACAISNSGLRSVPSRSWTDRTSARLDSAGDDCSANCVNACGDAVVQAGLECLANLICSAW